MQIHWPLSCCPWEWGTTQENDDTLAPTTAVSNKLSLVPDPEILSLYQDPQNCGRLSQLGVEQNLRSFPVVTAMELNNSQVSLDG